MSEAGNLMNVHCIQADVSYNQYTNANTYPLLLGCKHIANIRVHISVKKMNETPFLSIYYKLSDNDSKNSSILTTVLGLLKNKRCNQK